MNAIPQTRRCCKCGESKPLTDFAVNRGNTLGRGYACRPCRAEYDAKRRPRKGTPRGPAPCREATPPPAGEGFPVARRNTRLRKWRYPVNETTRFGVAMIGGGYV